MAVKLKLKDATTYASFPAEKDNYIRNLSDSSRFVRFSKRSETCDIPPEAFEPLSAGKYMTEWKGISMIKCSMDLIAYQQLLWEVKPPTIIELGTAYGASACWMSDVMSAYGVATQIYTIDIDPNLCDPRAKDGKDNIHWIIGDCNKIEAAFPDKMLENLPHPWVVIDDAHINVVGVWEHLHRFTRPGDYYIMEDTNPLGPAKLTAGYSAPGFKGVGQAKLNQVKDFMASHDDDYLVDAKWQDMFGYNGSWNMNSCFIRV